jgi:hypothetical protein
MSVPVKLGSRLVDADFSFTPQSRHPADGLACPKSADFVAKVGDDDEGSERGF